MIFLAQFDLTIRQPGEGGGECVLVIRLQTSVLPNIHLEKNPINSNCPVVTEKTHHHLAVHIDAELCQPLVGEEPLDVSEPLVAEAFHLTHGYICTPPNAHRN